MGIQTQIKNRLPSGDFKKLFKVFGSRPLPKSKISNESVVLITMYKAGSVYLQKILKELLGPIGYKLVDFAGDAFRNGEDEGQYCIKNSKYLSEPGYFFGAFRGAYVRHFEEMSNNKIIVHVRDPRDCLVSLYFSWAYSHGAPGGKKGQEFKELREKTKETEINDFVLKKAQDFVSIYSSINSVLEQYPQACLSKYEDLVTDFEGWLATITGFLALDIDQRNILKLLDRANFDVVEDKRKHVRQVTPGDYKRKLDIETQQQLTEIFSSQLETFGYLD